MQRVVMTTLSLLIMDKDAWKTRFWIACKGRHFLVIESGKVFSYNMICYKTMGGAIKGARAAYNKINKEFEKIVLA